MELQKQNILFFFRGNQHGGTENVVVQMCKILKNKVNSITVCCADGFNFELLEDLGIESIVIPDIEKKSLKNLVSVIKTLSDIIRKKNITVIHTHHRMAAFYTFLLMLKNRFTFVNTSHNTFYNKKFITRIVYKKANLTTCGEMVKKNLEEFFQLNDCDIKVLHNAIEPFEESINEIDTLKDLKDSGYFLVGNVGRLSEQKGMEYFICSFPFIKEKNHKVKYVVVGDGEDRDKLNNLVQKLEIEEDVIFLGYRNDVRNVISQLDLLVLSSLWEGLPLTPIEAFSVSKTVVATAVDGTVEIVEDGVNGFLIEPRNSKQIADRVMELVNNLEKKSYMERMAKITYNDKFSFEQYENKLLNYYLNL